MTLVLLSKDISRCCGSSDFSFLLFFVCLFCMFVCCKNQIIFLLGEHILTSLYVYHCKIYFMKVNTEVSFHLHYFFQSNVLNQLHKSITIYIYINDYKLDCREKIPFLSFPTGSAKYKGCCICYLSYSFIFLHSLLELLFFITV